MNTKLNAIISAIRSPRLWAALSSLAPGLALANPTGGDVVGGAAAISNPDANTVRIDQTSDRAAINWQSFSVDGQQFVIFNQPSVSSATLNRVLGGDPSVILGHLQANGRVFLINPNGVLFGQGAQVDVNGLVATTLDISPQDFLAGKFEFKGSSDKGVINAGSIQTGEGGFVVLTGDHVQNAGQINARLGKVVLASGSEVTLDIKGNGLVSYAINAAAVTDAAGVENLGSIAADGGSVVMDARVARSLTATVVNNDGLIQARTISTDKRGNVYLNGDGGNVVNQGVVDVSASAAGAKAGTAVVHSTKDITLTDGSRISANGDKGGEIRVVAEKVAALDPGSVVEATGDTGFIELSGHQRLDINGDVNLYHGMLLIDPAEVVIDGEAGSGPPSGNSSTSTITEFFLEQQLSTGNDVIIVATQQIRAQYISGDAIEGRDLDSAGGYGNGGSLTLGIGIVNTGAGSYGGYTAYGFYGPNGLQPDGVFTRGPGGGGGAYGIDLNGVAIRADDNLKIIGGYAEGMVRTGDLESTAGDITVTAYGDIKTGNLNAAGHDITVAAAYGALNFFQNQIFADHISLSGGKGVTLIQSTLAGKSGFFGDDSLTYAASTIGIYAGATADILIDNSPFSVTGRDITIEGGNVTIVDETLSGGHNRDNSLRIGADTINIKATGSGAYGDVLVENSQIIGGHITLDGRNNSVTVRSSTLAGRDERDLTTFRTDSTSGSFSSIETTDITGADLIELYGGAVEVTGSGIAAKTIFVSGASVTLTSDSTDPFGLALNIRRTKSASGTFGSGASTTTSSADAIAAEADGNSITISSPGTVFIAGGGLVADSISVRGNSVAFGSSAGSYGPTFAGGSAEIFSSSGSPFRLTRGDAGGSIKVYGGYGGISLFETAFEADTINLTGIYATGDVNVGGSTLGGGFGFDADGLSDAADSIEIHAGADANIFIGNSDRSVTAEDITITGGNVTIANEILSGGHDVIGANARGADHIAITATGEGVEEGMVSLLNATLLAANTVIQGEEINITSSELGRSLFTGVSVIPPPGGSLIPTDGGGIFPTLGMRTLSGRNLAVTRDEGGARYSLTGGYDNTLSITGTAGAVQVLSSSHLAAGTLTLNSATAINTSGSLLTIGAQGNFTAPSVTVGRLEMVGTNLLFHTDALTIDGEGPIFRPGDLDPTQIFAQFTPLHRLNLRLEQTLEGVEDPDALLIGVEEHLSKFPGTTFAFGGDGFTGLLDVGLLGPILGASDNFIFIGGPGAFLNGLPGFPLGGVPQLTTSGAVVFLGSFANVSPEADALLNEFSQFADDEEKRRKEREENSETQIADGDTSGQIETAPPDGATQECS